MNEFRCKPIGSNVLINLCGKTIEVPYDIAIDISKSLMNSARYAEEYHNANKIIYDQAILTRTGAFFGLTNNKKILDEAKKESVWNGLLRKYIKRHKQREVFGTPTIIGGK